MNHEAQLSTPVTVLVFSLFSAQGHTVSKQRDFWKQFLKRRGGGEREAYFPVPN